MTDPTPTIVDGPSDAATTLILAHGAGAPMDSILLSALAKGVSDAGIRVVRFEFPYMAARRSGGKRGMPDHQPVLLETWKRIIDQFRVPRLFIGGHSMGGRMASMIADECGVQGLFCVAYPWHPPGRPTQLRTAHLKELKTPTVMIVGTRDEFGSPDEVATYSLSSAIRVHWIDGADHSLRAKAKSGRTVKQNLAEAVSVICGGLT